MLNEDSPATEIKKADLTKIKKLEEALAKLKSGEENYYGLAGAVEQKLTVSAQNL